MFVDRCLGEGWQNADWSNAWFLLLMGSRPPSVKWPRAPFKRTFGPMSWERNVSAAPGRVPHAASRGGSLAPVSFVQMLLPEAASSATAKVARLEAALRSITDSCIIG